ncbi:MAG: ABC transporter substrate-binding protein [Dethiobacteria bacterium]
MLKRLFAIILLVVMAAFLVSGCDPSTAPGGEQDGNGEPAGEGEEIVIGTLYPHSGARAMLGEESWRGAELARQKWNEKGGINGKQIVFVNADIPDTGAATAEAERLISKEGLTVLVGSYASDLATAASEVTERYGVIYFEMGGIADGITERGFKWLFRSCPRASSFGIMGMQAAAELAPKALGKDVSELKVAVVFEDGPYGSAVGDYAKAEAERLGMQVVAFEPYSSDAADLSSLIERLKAAEPDVMSITSYLTDSILFAEQARELNFNVPMFIGNGGGHSMQDLADAIGDDIVGMMNADFTQFDVNFEYTPGLDEFLERYKNEYGGPPRSGHSLMNYYGALLLFEAIENAGGSLEPADVREGILALDIPEFSTATGLGADFNTETNDNARAWPTVMQWRKVDGEYKQLAVFPEELAVTEAELPMPPWGER